MDDASVQRLETSLAELGVETSYLGRPAGAERIVTAVVEREADAVELCLSGPGGVPLLRELLRELIRVGRRDVSIVVHRADPLCSSGR